MGASPYFSYRLLAALRPDARTTCRSASTIPGADSAAASRTSTDWPEEQHFQREEYSAKASNRSDTVTSASGGRRGSSWLLDGKLHLPCGGPK